MQGGAFPGAGGLWRREFLHREEHPLMERSGETGQMLQCLFIFLLEAVRGHSLHVLFLRNKL